MEIVVKGRNVVVPEHFRVHVAEKMASIERFDNKVVRYDVELYHEKNPRLSKVCQRIEITGSGKASVIRAEAAGPDFYAALDTAMRKLEERLRRLHDRRRVHHGRRHPVSVAEATAPLAGVLFEDSAAQPDESTDVRHDHEREWESTAVDGPGRVVRTKRHSAEPMTVDQALYEMELVGHDFYLFTDASSGRPSVVYRRKAFDYGMIQLVEPGGRGGRVEPGPS